MTDSYQHIYRRIVGIILTDSALLLSTIVDNKWMKDEIEKAILFLDQVASWDFKELDKYYSLDRLIEPELAEVVSKKFCYPFLTSSVFQIRDYFELKSDLASNSIFRQKLEMFMEIERFASQNCTDEHDLAYVTNVNCLIHNDDRIQFAILKYLALTTRLDRALFYALLFQIPETNWPLYMKENVSERDKEVQTQIVREFSQHYPPLSFALVDFYQPFPNEFNSNSNEAIEYHYSEDDLYTLITDLILKKPTKYLDDLKLLNLSVEELTCIVEYLDEIVAWHHACLDKRQLDESDPRLSQAMRIFDKVNCKNLIAIIYNICSCFNLSMKAVKHAVFVR